MCSSDTNGGSVWMARIQVGGPSEHSCSCGLAQPMLREVRAQW